MRSGGLPLPVQVKLPRVTQKREMVRVGSRRSIQIDVRLLAATHVHLEEAVAAGRFAKISTIVSMSQCCVCLL